MQLCWLDRGMVVGVGYWVLTFSIKSKTFFNKTRVDLDTMNHRGEMGSILNFKSLKWKLIWNIGNMLKCPWYFLWFQMTRGRPAFEASLKSLLSHHDHMEIPHIELPADIPMEKFSVNAFLLYMQKKGHPASQEDAMHMSNTDKMDGWVLTFYKSYKSQFNCPLTVYHQFSHTIFLVLFQRHVVLQDSLKNMVKLAIWSEFTFRHAR